MDKSRFKKIEEKVTNKIESNIFAFNIFDEPRPNYVSKVTFFDKIFAATILKLIPHYVRPNFLTVIRFITIPFLVYFLISEHYLTSLIIFFISASTDALDGAIARTRHQITDWGIVFDPLADKLLIGSVSLIVISKFINPILAITIVLLEVFLIISSYVRFKGKVVPAKTVGKIKMILQSIGVFTLLLSVVIVSPFLTLIATLVLYLSIFFAFLSLFIYRSI